MKRFAALIIALVLMVAPAHAEKWNRYNFFGIPDIDYMKASVTVEELPEMPVESMPVFYADNKCIFLPTYNNSIIFPVLYNAENGMLTELQPLPEDEAVWMELYTDSIRWVKFPEDQLASVLDKLGAAGAFFFVVGEFTCYRHEVAGNYVLMQCNSSTFLIDTEKGVIRPSEIGEVMEDGTVISLPVGATAYTFIAQDGTVNEVQLNAEPGYEWGATGSAFSDDSAYVIIRGTYMDSERRQNYSVGFVEDTSNGNVTDIKYLGSYSMTYGFDGVIKCGNDAAIVYNSGSLLFVPPVLVRRGNAAPVAFMWNNGQISEYQLDDVRNDDGNLHIPEGCAAIIPVGVSADGRYGLFIEGVNYSLIAVDLDTMEWHMLLSGWVAREIMDDSLLRTVRVDAWNGENYINMNYNYRLRFEYDK